ncbi:MAG TPA: GNAT family N-acetyltransferase [Terriglobales bacterium]|nr:GNAT family N-acetyltransferase [Terriglobales bacterium]
MIRHYARADPPAVKAALAGEPDKLALLSTYLEVSDMLYFDLWLTDNLDVIIFRSYGSFYMKLEPSADLEEVALFLGFMPMLGSVESSSECMEALAIQLPGVKSTAQTQTAVLESGEGLKGIELEVTRAASIGDLRLVYSLLAGENIRGLAKFDDYCFSRRALTKSGLGRTLSLVHGGQVFATASTSAETGEYALIADVVTNAKYRRQGLAAALVSCLCRELLAEGKKPLVTYTSAEAGKLYESLGFKPAGTGTILYFG